MIKSCAAQILAAPPVWQFLHRRAVRDRPATILCYHTLGPENGGTDGWTVLPVHQFRAQLDHLKTHYDIVSLDTVLEGTGDPDRTVRPQAVLTFDDGDRGLARHLVPILKDEGVPVTVYVATEQFETGKAFWFDRVVNALHAPRAIDIDLKKHGRTIWHFPPVSGKPRWSILGRLLETLKAADPALRETLTEEIVAQAPAGDEGGLGPMSRRELRHLADLPGVTIGAHSHGHELLDQIPLAAARESIARSRALLRDWTGQKIRHFAFPNGNHSAELRTTVRDLGFSSATILEERTAPRHTDPFALPRISVGRYDALARFKLRLAGL